MRSIRQRVSHGPKRTRSRDYEGARDRHDERGYPFIHDRSRKKNKKGKILDLHIYLAKGRHVVIELKVKGNTMSDEQKETYQKIHFLGHEIEEVRSYKRFLEIMNGAPTTNIRGELMAKHGASLHKAAIKPGTKIKEAVDRLRQGVCRW